MLKQNRHIDNFEVWNDSMSRKYDIDRYRERSSWIIRKIENLRQKAILKQLDVKPRDDVVDLGCGAGHLLAAIGAGQLVGIDFSEYSLQLAKRRLGERARLMKGDVQNLPPDMAGNKFDKIVCSEVIEHLPHPEKLLDEIGKLAKPDSIIVITVPNERVIHWAKQAFIGLGIFKLLFPNIPENNLHEWHLHRFDRKVFQHLSADKLIIRAVVPVPVRWFPLHYVFTCKIPPGQPWIWHKAEGLSKGTSNVGSQLASDSTTTEGH